MKVLKTSLKARQNYEVPKVEVIEIEPQGVLCVSGDAASSSFTGSGGVHFGSDGGSW